MSTARWNESTLLDRDASGQAVLQRIGGQRGTRGADLARRLALSA